MDNSPTLLLLSCPTLLCTVPCLHTLIEPCWDTCTCYICRHCRAEVGGENPGGEIPDLVVGLICFWGRTTLWDCRESINHSEGWSSGSDWLNSTVSFSPRKWNINISSFLFASPSYSTVPFIIISIVFVFPRWVRYRAKHPCRIDSSGSILPFPGKTLLGHIYKVNQSVLEGPEVSPFLGP